MKITPKKESDLPNPFAPLPAGEYPFTVLESGEVAAKSAKNKGRLMFALKLNVHGDGRDKHVFDYFADWFSEYKLRHFAIATNQLAQYESGEFDASGNAFQGLTGWVKIKVKPAKDNFPEGNEVEDYFAADAEPKEKVAKASSKPETLEGEQPEDDIPF